MSLPSRHLLPSGQGPRPMLPLPGGLGLGLLRGRVHEVCGPGRWTLAALLMAADQGAVVWMTPGWGTERVYAPGLAEFADPARVIFAQGARAEDLLWGAEEALRSGAVPLVLVDLPDPPGLTPVRRLHLAAEAGGEVARRQGRALPLAVLLTAGAGGAQGVESRWQMRPAPSRSTLLEQHRTWSLTRLRARMEPPATWTLSEGERGRIDGHPATGEAAMPKA